MRPVRIRVEHRIEGSITDHEFVNSPVRLGRNRLNDLPLVYGFVSGWHAVIRFDEETARFFDLGSTNGTEQDGRRIMPGETVAFDDPVTIQIGDLNLTLSRSAMPSQLPVGPQHGGGPSTGPNSWMRGSATSEAKAGVIDPNAAEPTAQAPKANETAHVPMGQIHASVAALRPMYQEAHNARLRFERALHEHVSVLPPHLREQAEQYFRREFGDEAPRSPAATGAEPVRSAVTSAGVVGLAELLLPELQPPATDDEAERFLAAVRDVLEACANSMVELQKGQEQFGREMSVKAIKEFTPLHVAASAQDVLSYLLDWRHGGRTGSRSWSGSSPTS